MIDYPWVLPVTWRWARFADVARVASNLVDPTEYPDAPHIAPNHIESEKGRLLPYATVRTDGVTSAKHRFFPGQVLYSKIRPYLAKVVVADFEGLCSADMYPIESDLDPRFLKWWMLTPEFTRRAAGEQARTVLPKINIRALSTLPVPVPPEPEQRQIVEILEDHLSRLDAAEATLRLADQKLEAALLSHLSSELFAKSWPQIPLMEVLTTSTGGLWGGEPGVEAVDVRVIRVTELKTGGRVVPETAARRSVRLSQLASRELRVGDLLLEKSGGGPSQPVGRVGMIERLEEPSVCSNFMHLLRPDPKSVDSRFLFWYLHAFYLRGGTLPMQKASTNIRNLKSAEYLRMCVPLPELASQVEITERISEFSAARDRLRSGLKVAASRNDGLRRSLLCAAFSGRLTGRTSNIPDVEELAGV